MDKLIPVKFNDEVVITTKTLAQVYECDESNIKVNFNSNKDKFIEGKHYYKLQGEELKNLRVSNPYLQISPKTRTLYLWTKIGASRHCKMLGTDKAWDMFDTLEENYFNPKVPQLTNEQLKAKLLLDIYNGGENGVLASKQLAELEKKPLKEKIEKDTPKVDYFDALVDRSLLTNFRDTAKELHIRQKDFINWLLENNFIYRDSNNKIKPTAQTIEEGLFELKEFTNEHFSSTQTLVTPKGRETFRLLLEKNKLM